MQAGLEAGERKPLGPGFLDDLPMTGQELWIAGQYRVLKIIGRGGLGGVYKAWQAGLSRPVAVKVITCCAHTSSEEKARFLQGARAAARLRHPGIVAVFEWGEEDEIPFFAMEYIEGRDLARVVKEEGPLEARRAAELMREAVAAVAWAHGQGILHGDLKPQNLLLDTGGGVKITDFGLARRLDAQRFFLASQQMLGAAGYMAPEQAGGGSPVGPGVDIYGLGAVLYHLLAGRAPFVGKTLEDVCQQATLADPAPLRRLNARVPEGLEAFCLKCLAKEPQQRYSTMVEVAAELGRFLAGEPVHAQPRQTD